MKKLKLLLIHGSLTPYRIDFFNRLAEFYELKVYFFYAEDPSQKFDVKSLEKEVKFAFDYILSGFSFLNRTYRFGVGLVFKKEKPDIVITHEFSSFTFKALVYKKIKGNKISWFITSDDSLGSLEDMPLYRRIARKLILPHIDGLITISNDVKKWHLSNYPELDLKIFDLPILRNPEVYRNKLNIALPISMNYRDKYNLSGKKNFLFIGRLSKEKGIDRFVQIFSTLKDEDVRLIIVGDGELKKVIKDFLSRTNEKRVILPGRFDNIELLAWYNVANIFVLPSFNERFGAVINEALLAGLYTLCSKKAGASSLIKLNKNGVLIDPLDTADILNKLITVAILCPRLEKKIEVKENLMTVDFNSKMINLRNSIK